MQILQDLYESSAKSSVALRSLKNYAVDGLGCVLCAGKESSSGAAPAALLCCCCCCRSPPPSCPLPQLQPQPVPCPGAH
eukprot:215037-Rhodomonas_salina.1